MRLALITDVHANLPTLEAALAAITREEYDLLIHTGDLIGIGPFLGGGLAANLLLP